MKSLTKDKVLSVIEVIKKKIHNFTYDDGSPYFEGRKPEEPEVVNSIRTEEIYNLAHSLLIKVYGTDSQVYYGFETQMSNYIDPNISHDTHDTLEIILGKLEYLKTEIELGLLQSLEQEISGEIYGDLLLMARSAIDNDAKDTAAVLCSAALEEATKKLAFLNDINIENKSLTEVTNALKTKGLIKGIQSKLFSTYISIRNKAAHADWNKIEQPDVKSMIAFTEEFIAKHF
ncbi:MAG: DUF4145 domain-containing protein [Rivularia sp. (in: Bacteria)]|nr:DUF4145 domain-containing protein [Rivularia sp. MS3]MBV6643621.1 DUF4145 domain-containing protein [Cyclobacteriaceae bacterium SS2]